MRDEAIQHAIYLRRYSNGLAKRMIKLLNSVDVDVIRQIERGRLGDKKRLESVLEEIRIINRDIHKEMMGSLQGELFGVANHQAEVQAALVAKRLGKTPVVISADTLASLVTDEPFNGRTLREWGDSLQDASFNRLREAINIGSSEGQTTEQIVDRVRGLERLRFKDGLQDVSRRQAQSLVRTAVTHSTSKADEEVYKRQKAIKSVQYSAILDSRTTPICSDLDGELFKVGEGPRPPQHFNCRSTTIAVFDDQQPFKETYSAWIKRQPASFQDEVLGPTRGKLLRDGGLSIGKFVDRGAKKHYTLEQLRVTEKAAFKKAGL